MIDEKLKTIANYLREAFCGTPKVQRYYAADNNRFVDILSTPHDDKVSYLGTIGCSSRKMKGQPEGTREIRVEIITAINENCENIMAETLSFLTFCLDTDKAFYIPGTIIENAIPSEKTKNVKHIYLCDPFLWDNGLPCLQFDTYPVAFLYALPITDAEKEYCSKNGVKNFENLLSSNGGVKYNDFNRKSLV